MGADGGSIATRQDILSNHTTKSQHNVPQGEDKEENLIKTCHFSTLPLYGNDPIVGDCRGKLYIKEYILKYILGTKKDKANVRAEFSHIALLKDISPVHVFWTVVDKVPFIECPVTKEVERGFSYLRTCGCLVSSKALREFKHEGKCPNCNLSFEDYDVVVLDPLNKKENVALNDKNMEVLQGKGLSHSKLPLKKAKKKTLDSSTDEFVRKRKPQEDAPTTKRPKSS
ncbi:Replication termination factor 2 [Candida viswanathii]|uniref:Replication termination factor 2 n=1 Tax=Candida viswanathii TaxID=5486 RepID=A0A367Y5K3_9ASCO|nr:Replication termination factor 2 [Candida viswanathii]